MPNCRAARSLFPRFRSSTDCTWCRITASRFRLSDSGPAAPRTALPARAEPEGSARSAARITPLSAPATPFPESKPFPARSPASFMLQQPRQRSRSKCNRALLIALADAVKKTLRQRPDIPPGAAERGNGKTHSVSRNAGRHSSPCPAICRSEVATRKQHRPARRTVLQRLQKPAAKPLARRRKQVYPIKISAPPASRIGVRNQPLAGHPALKCRVRQRRT